MIVAHITEEMAFAVRGAVVAMLTRDAAAVGVTLPLAHTALAAEGVEALAANVHDQWMATKRASGIATRRSESGEELMVPYADLSEPQKEMDRVLVRTVLRAMGRLAP